MQVTKHAIGILVLETGISMINLYYTILYENPKFNVPFKLS